jgi:predicted kinase
LTDPIVIFDCIEFSEEFRRIDIADELAFLAAECDFLGGDWIGPQLFRAYAKRSGDCPAEILVDFYKAYRACVRAKVAALRADQLEGEAHERAKAEAEMHLALADKYVARWLRPLVLVVGGLVGTGKSMLAKAVAEAIGAELLRTDVVRRELFGAGPHAAQFDGGFYATEDRERVYARMFEQAAALSADRISVVLDGTFSTVDAVNDAKQLAVEPDRQFLAIECVCRPEVARGRISRRLKEGRDASEARPEIHDLQRVRWEPWEREVPQMRIDTEETLERQVERIMAGLAAKQWF